ncbi:2OG-Fe(II) oxygenase [Andreprevotia chitinilytica]|uniref:2OG-Fe(II) oxygenase n=1 Tax=Andreprevotia chitinilytica TaxID=396808 RepID=UPI000554173A|nr:2OG-Fe(II) oxygenase [Andreprevotia chitinilytica]
MVSLDAIADALVDPGWVEIPGFLSEREADALLTHAKARRDDFSRAGIGRAGLHQLNAAIRSDEVLWLDKEDGADSLAWHRLEELRAVLNQALFLGLAELECHLAVYPEGSFYARHIDQHRNQDTRVITVVLYLNPDWRDEHGGELRLYLDDGTHRDIRPEAGKLVVFMSDRFEHEVLPAKRERWSLTGWYRRRAV